MPLTGVQILCICEELQVRDHLKSILLSGGAELTLCADRIRALSLLVRHPDHFAAILTDLPAQSHDASIYLHQIRQAAPDISLVVVGAYRDFESSFPLGTEITARAGFPLSLPYLLHCLQIS